MQRGVAGISVGSFLARVNASTGLLNSVLGGFIGGNLTLVGYTGIAAGAVQPRPAPPQLGFGTVDELLAANITYRNLLNATAAALSAKGDTASLNARAAVLALATAANSALSLKLGDLIKVATGDGNSAADADINVHQLAMMAAQVANGSNAVSVNLSTSSLGGLGGLLSGSGNSVELKVIEPPQMAIGPAAQDPDGTWKTVARTAQVRLYVQLRPLGTVLGGLLNLPHLRRGGVGRGLPARHQLRRPQGQQHSQRARRRPGGPGPGRRLTDIGASTAVVGDATILNVARSGQGVRSVQRGPGRLRPRPDLRRAVRHGQHADGGLDHPRIGRTGQGRP